MTQQTQTQTQTKAPWTNAEKNDVTNPDLGLDKNAEQKVIQHLEQTLVDTYAVYLKSQNAHWNVTGPMFKPLHDLFEEHYQEMFGALDELAERIRTIGGTAPATFKEFSKRSTIPEWDTPPKANTMIHDLVKDHETVIHGLRGLVEHAEKANDEATVDMAVERLAVHEKNAWMLRVHLE